MIENYVLNENLQYATNRIKMENLQKKTFLKHII